MIPLSTELRTRKPTPCYRNRHTRRSRNILKQSKISPWYNFFILDPIYLETLFAGGRKQVFRNIFWVNLKINGITDPFAQLTKLHIQCQTSAAEFLFPPNLFQTSLDYVQHQLHVIWGNSLKRQLNFSFFRVEKNKVTRAYKFCINIQLRYRWTIWSMILHGISHFEDCVLCTQIL